MTATKNSYYDQAFSRNIGILTPEEQIKLKNTRVAIIGMGGMGGIGLLTLVRMGVGKFIIADFDTFSPANSNRQAGASSQTMGQSKISVMEKMAKDISPDIEIQSFPQGLQKENADLILKNCDIVFDAIDFLCISARELLYKKAQEHGKTVLISAPLGFSCTLQVFTPDSMTFHDYFDFQPGMDNYDKLLTFAVGLAPALLHNRYMNFDPEKLTHGIGASIGSTVNLGSGLLATELISIVLNRRPPLKAPYYIQFDPYLLRLKKGKLILGNRGPIQKLKRWIVGRQYEKYRTQINQVVS